MGGEKALFSALKALKSSSSRVTWKSTGRLQQTIRSVVEVTGEGLHSGKLSTVRIKPEVAGKGRHLDLIHESRCSIPATVHYAKESPLCTTLFKDGFAVRTVEHLLSALEASGVDNCRIEIANSDPLDPHFEVPILDGSSRQWVEEIGRVGLVVVEDESGNTCERLAPCLNEPVAVWKKDSFVAAFPSQDVRISYGVDFPQVPAIGCQWISLAPLNESSYLKEVAPSRTFCVYEEVEHLHSAGLIAGGSLDNAIVCSTSKGWLNPPLRFSDEPCRHKVLDLIGDLSLFARLGNQGLPKAHIVAYKDFNITDDKLVESSYHLILGMVITLLGFPIIKRVRVLYEGPWIIQDHYLAARCWIRDLKHGHNKESCPLKTVIVDASPTDAPGVIGFSQMLINGLIVKQAGKFRLFTKLNKW